MTSASANAALGPTRVFAAMKFRRASRYTPSSTARKNNSRIAATLRNNQNATMTNANPARSGESLTSRTLSPGSRPRRAKAYFFSGFASSMSACTISSPAPIRLGGDELPGGSNPIFSLRASNC